MFNRSPTPRPGVGAFFRSMGTSPAGTGLAHRQADLTGTRKGFMSYAYEGLATVGVLALYREQPPNRLTTFELNVRILNVGPKRFRVEFDRYLQGPTEANAIQVILPGGLVLQGPIVDGSNEPFSAVHGYGMYR